MMLVRRGRYLSYNTSRGRTTAFLMTAHSFLSLSVKFVSIVLASLSPPLYTAGPASLLFSTLAMSYQQHCPCVGIMDIELQGRLHHINDGANAPWKWRDQGGGSCCKVFCDLSWDMKCCMVFEVSCPFWSTLRHGSYCSSQSTGVCLGMLQELLMTWSVVR